MKLVGDHVINDNLYRVGNVIYNNGDIFIVSEIEDKYTLINLNTGVSTMTYNSEEELRKSLADNNDVPVSGQKLVDFG